MALLFSLVGIVDYGRVFHLMAKEMGWAAFHTFCLHGGIGASMVLGLIVLGVRRLIKVPTMVLGCMVIVVGIILLNFEAIGHLLSLAVIGKLLGAMQAHEIVDTVMQNRNFDYLVQRAMLGLMKPKFENDEIISAFNFLLSFRNTI